MSAPERHSAETKNNGTAIRHAPQRIVANKSKGAQWGSSGRWISPHTPQFGMCVEYVRADLHDALLTRLASAEAALARAREEAQSAIAYRVAEDDLRKHWHMFCDADHFPGSEDFAERMEEKGLIEIVSVDDDALEDPFAAERGIEPGGFMWRLTPAGEVALRNGETGGGER